MPNRDRIHNLLRDMALATVPVVGAFLCFVLWPTRAAIRSNSTATGALIQKANASLDGLNAFVQNANKTLVSLNAPCVGFHGSSTCGPIAQLAQTEKNVGILAGQGALQVRQSGQLVTAAADSLTAVSAHVNGAVDHLGDTAKSATATLDAGRSYFVTRQPKFDLFVDNLNDVTDRTTYSLDLFNARLADPNLALVLKNVSDITGTGAHMLVTADKVETKLSQCTLHPTFACQARGYTLFGAQTAGYLLQAVPK